MKVLLVIDKYQNAPYFINSLSSLTEDKSIIICNSFLEAKNFIRAVIIKKQSELDVIVLQNKIPKEDTNATVFHRQILFDLKSIYSNYDFNWRSIPVMILMEEGYNRTQFIETLNYEGTDLIETPKHFHLYLPDIVNKIKSWRRGLLDELSNLGIEAETGFKRIKEIDLKRLNRPTNILSDNFKLFPRRLNYPWLFANIYQIEKSIDEYVKELKRAEGRVIKDEKRFHRFFNKYPNFLKRDIYSKQWYEPRLKIGQNLQDVDEYLEPDFALMPSITKHTDLSILEIKLPNEKFITKTKFHPRPYSSFLSHLFQISDYKEYLENLDYSSVVKNVFGLSAKNFEYQLLIGRDKQLEEAEFILKLRMKQMNMDYINLITYDQLMEYQVKFLERLKFLEIK